MSAKRFYERVTADFERLAKIAAKVGFFVALVCNVLPPHYRAVCHALASLCSGGN